MGCLYKVEGIGDDGLGYRYFTGPRREDATKGKFFSGVPTERRRELAAGTAKKYKPILNFKNMSDAFGNCRHEGGVEFSSGKKPTEFLQFILSIVGGGEYGYTVLDFFAGSCSAAHAVLDLNKQDGGNRKFIMVQLPEPCDKDSEAFKAGYKNIADIGKERIRRVIKKIQAEQAQAAKQAALPGMDDKPKALDLGFKVFKLASSNIKTWDPDFNQLEHSLVSATEPIKPDRSEADVLYEILLKYGLDLTLPTEKREIGGKTVHIIGGGGLVVCLAKNMTLDVVEKIAALKDEFKPETPPGMRVVFKDAGFAGDELKTNAVQILKQRGIEDVRAV